MEESYLVIYIVGVLCLGLAAQWLAWRFRLPAILVLLAFGFAAGQWKNPDDLVGRDLLLDIVSLSVAVVLFEGGLSLRFREIRETSQAVFRLVTVGILVSWLLTTVIAHLVLGLEIRMSALVGAILVVSGPTVIMPLLRHIRPVRHIGTLVKWEGIINDPIGAVLAVLVFGAVLAGNTREAATATFAGLGLTIVISGAIGMASAAGLIAALRRFWIPDYLENLCVLSVVLASFVASNLIQPESGLVTVTLLGIILANQRMAELHHVIEFKENLRVLLISCLFILLASRLQLSAIAGLGVSGLVFITLLIVLVRPITVLLSTLGTGMQFRERLFLAWLAPRGIVAAAVSSVFALKLSHHAGLSVAMAASVEKLVPVTFLVIVGTVTIYGLTAGMVARLLGLAESNPQGILFVGAEPIVQEIAKTIQVEGIPVLLVDTNPDKIASARMAGLPTCWANISSHFAREELDLGGIGRILAMTPNDDVNALAVDEFSELFGRAESYQLAPHTTETTRQTRMAPKRLGRVLFRSEIHFAQLATRYEEGAVVKKNLITDEFDHASFLDMYGETAIILFVLEESGRLQVVTDTTKLIPTPGQKLISLVKPLEDAY